MHTKSLTFLFLLFTIIYSNDQDTVWGKITGVSVHSHHPLGVFDVHYTVFYVNGSPLSGTVQSWTGVDTSGRGTFLITVPEGSIYSKSIVVTPQRTGFVFGPPQIIINPFANTVWNQNFEALDVQSPTAEILAPIDTMVVYSEDSIRVLLLDNSCFVIQYQYYVSIDNGPFAPICTVFTFIGDGVKDQAWKSSDDWSVKRLSYTPPTPGTYTVKVEVLDAAGNFGQDTHTFYVVDTTYPSLTLNSPVGNEKWKVGSTQIIQWIATDNTAIRSRSIHFSGNNGISWALLDSTSANTGTWQWNIPNPPTTQASIKVKVYDLSGNSVERISPVFEIIDSTTPDTIAPSVVVTNPVGGTVFARNTPILINWTVSDNKKVISEAIYLSTDNGYSFSLLDSTDENINTLNWVTPDSDFSQCIIKVRAYDSTGNQGTGLSGIFKVRDTTAPLITVHRPLPDFSYFPGVLRITLAASDNVVSKSIHYGSSNITSLIDSSDWSGEFIEVPWTITQNMETDQAVLIVRVYDESGNCAVKNVPFKILDSTLPYVQFTCTPDSIGLNEEYDITWEASHPKGIKQIILSVSVDNGSTYTPIVALFENTGSYTWTSPLTEYAHCFFRISAYNGITDNETISSKFSIKYIDKDPPIISMTSVPNIQTNSSYKVKWTSNDNSAMSHVFVYFSADSGSLFTLLDSIGTYSRGDTGTYLFTAPDTSIENCQFKLTAYDKAGNNNEMKSNIFKIQAPTSIKKYVFNPQKFEIKIMGKDILIAMEKNSSVLVEIFRLDGKKLMNQTMMLTVGYHRLGCNLSGGIYILKIKRTDLMFVTKFRLSI